MDILIAGRAWRADLPEDRQGSAIALPAIESAIGTAEAPDVRAVADRRSEAAALVAHEARREVERAQALHPGAQHSAHEGFAVLLEEVDELKAHVWTKQRDRDLAAMRKEAIQVAAMAMRFVIDVCDGGRGRV